MPDLGQLSFQLTVIICCDIISKNERKVCFPSRISIIMSQNKRKQLHTVCGIITAVLVLMAGICFILSCLSIYKSGEKPFSPESVAAHFKMIRIPVLACIISVAVSAILALIFPQDAPKTKSIRAQIDILSTLKAKAGSVTDEELTMQLRKEQNRFQAINIILTLSMIAFFARPFLFFLKPFRFTVESLNRDILQFLFTFVLYSIAFLACAIIRAYLTRSSIQKLIAVYKSAIAEHKCDGIAPAPEAKKECKHGILIARCAVAAIAVVFILLGIFNGGIQDVLGKAIAICTECIGLG